MRPAAGPILVVLTLLLSGCGAGDRPGAEPTRPAAAPAKPAVLVPPEEIAAPEQPAYEPRPEGGVTFAGEIAPILFEHCVACHRPGESGPFSLLTYAEARNRARQILDVVRSGFMPPWLPEPGYNAFLAERRLTDVELGLLAQWVRDGAPEGDPAATPTPPEWTAGWQLGEPDMVLDVVDEPYVLRAEPPDVYRTFVVPEPVEGTRWVRAFEFRPGNYTVVHHAVIEIDETHGSRRLDADDPGPGFGGMHLEGARHPDGHYLAWVPGRIPYPSHEERAWRLDERMDLVVELHMLPSGKQETVRPTMGLHFAERPPSQRPFVLHLGKGTHDIPAGVTDYIHEDSYRLPVDVELLTIVPHAHYLAKDMKAWAELPDGSKRWLLRIKDWDFNWQDEYRYVEPVRLPKGTRVVMRFSYDNSANNVRNPHHPPQRVKFGPFTYDEMGDLWLQVLPSAIDFGVLAQHYQQFSVDSQIERWTLLSERDPDDANPPNNLGHQLMRAGRVPEAVAAFRRSVELDPEYANARENLAVALFQIGQPEEAVLQFREAQLYEPDDSEARTNLAHVLGSLGRMEESIVELEHALRVDPDLPRAHVNLGRALELTGRLDRALEHYLAGVKHEPEWLLALNYAAKLLALHPDPARRDGERAIELATRAAELTRYGDPAVLDTLASAYAAAGDFDRAIKSATTALDGLRRAAPGQAQQLAERIARYRMGVADDHPSVTR